MSLNNEKVVSVLNNLIDTCRDAEGGFRTAAENVDDDHLKTLFNNYCQQRAQLAAELEREVRRRGGEPHQGERIQGTLHQGWMNLRAALSHDDDGAVLAECERGEDGAIEEYQEALNAALPDDVKRIVSRQFAAVKAAHERIRELEKEHAKT